MLSASSLTRRLHWHTMRWAGAVVILTGLLVLVPLRPLGLLIGTIGAALLVLRWPWLFWVGLGMVLPITSGIKLGPLSLSDLLLAGGIMLWFVDGVRRRQVRLVFHPALPLLLGLIGVLYLALLQAVNLREASAELLKWVQFGLVLLIVPAMVPRERVMWLVLGLLLGAVGQGLLGIYQFIFRIGPEWFIILDRFMRASGTFNQPNPYAGYLGLTLPVAISLTLWSLQQFKRSPQQMKEDLGTTAKERRHNLQLLLLLCLSALTAVIGLGLLASWSRGGWLGAAGALAVVMGLRSRRALAAGGLVALIATMLVLIGIFDASWIPAPVVERFADVPAYLGLTDVLNEPLTDANFALVERMAHWVAALRMWESAPWLGVGPGNYAVVYSAVRLPLWEEPLGHAHNIYLNLLAESGLLGLMSFGALWLGILIWLWQQQRRQPVDWHRALVIGVIGVVVHLSIHNFFDNLFVQGSYLHIALWLAAVQTHSETNISTAG